MQNVKRIYVEKKPPYATAAKAVFSKIKDYLNITSVTGVRVLIRYDYENIPDDIFKTAIDTVFSEPPLDDVYYSLDTNDTVFTVEYLPGQFDQRADSAVQAIGLLGSDGALVRCATTYVLLGSPSKDEVSSIKSLVLNPVDSRIASEEIPKTLVEEFDSPKDVKVMDGFTDMEEAKLKKLYDSLSLAMTFKDMLHIQKYFKEDEKRNPTITEIRVFDTYWSDHCRHTTFSTHLKDIEFEDGVYKDVIKETFDSYKNGFETMYKGRDDKYVCLMDIALMAARQLKSQGYLDDQEESDEINACSIVIPVDVDGKTEQWLLNFKNETHNHPTEIEPFGGAATCLGGAIRDPLSGRTYCYQAMRITGAADPTVSIEQTLKGKLPQERIVTEAAEGYSSYGNQIGLATGLVHEIYHPGYAAKRMEIGAVMAAAPVYAVKREEPQKGDVIILLGGRTGRDGIGGATGSSKAHDLKSTEECGAEVQKGNAPTERKLQRLFRREDASLLIKRCNDFGAGGVSVAIGELAPGLSIDLDKVPKKYAGLDGTELCISESQERMAVVVEAKDVDKFLKLSDEENLEATPVAVVTDDERLTINWRGKNIVSVKRSFLDTNGALQEADAKVIKTNKLSFFDENPIKEVNESLSNKDYKAAVKNLVSDLNVCSQKGLIERFDSSIGAGTVLYPFGGTNQQTPIQTMVAKIPVKSGNTKSASMMSYGYDPYLSSLSPFHGASYAVLSSISKIVASGGDYKKIRFTFQEYFGRLGEDAARWGLPLSALLGAYRMQMGFNLPAIGGKDSMSGTFEDLDVPPTLCSFAVNTISTDNVISPEFKKTDSNVYLIKIKRDANDLPDIEDAKRVFDSVYKLNLDGKILSAYSIESYGAITAMLYMAFGNGIGFDVADGIDISELFVADIGSVIIETKETLSEGKLIAHTNDKGVICLGGFEYSLEEIVDTWEEKLDKVFPINGEVDPQDTAFSLCDEPVKVSSVKVAKPRVFIPVFPGTNTEFDLIRRFEKAGAICNDIVLNNKSAAQIEESIKLFKKEIENAQIIMFPGGFSAGDEPEGSAKFFSATFRNEALKEAIDDFLRRDGLILGVCNGFQALIKLGLLPYGEIRLQDSDSPTLTYNTIGRHISKIAYTKVISNKSPWLMNAKVGETYAVPISHGEGRFVAPKKWIEDLYDRGQVATRYVGYDGDESNNPITNPNGSFGAIEGITSPDGRILGKMGHVERIGDGVGLNIYKESDIKMFESGVKYFS